jgi:hypothetical protein
LTALAARYDRAIIRDGGGIMLDPRLYSHHLEYPRRARYGDARGALLQARGAATLDLEVGERLAGAPPSRLRMDYSHGQPCTPGTRYAIVDLHTGERFPLRTGINTIGRYQENDIVLQANAISRRHCVILVHADGRCEIHDTASRNGVIVNNVAIRAVWLTPGDQIRLCGKPFVLDVDDPQSPGPDSATAA